MNSRTPVIPRPALFAALVAAGALAAGVLVAAPRQAPGDVHEGRFAELDANGDGNISAGEFDALRARHLAQLDGNNDGFVTFDEHKAAREAMAREHFTRRHDRDGDGRVSVDEMADRGDGRFERMDGNDDGVVSQDEMRPRHRMIHRHGPDGE